MDAVLHPGLGRISHLRGLSGDGRLEVVAGGRIELPTYGL